MLRSFTCCSDEWKVDISCCCRRKFFLSFLSCFFQSLQCHLICRKIYAFLFLELRKHIICNLLVEVISTKSVITSCRKYFDNAITDLDYGYIECTTTKVVYHNLLLFLIIKTISKCCCCRLIDNTFYIKSCDLTCILGSLTLSIIEISRNSDNCLCNLFTEVSFCISFQLLKDHC